MDKLPDFITCSIHADKLRAKEYLWKQSPIKSWVKGGVAVGLFGAHDLYQMEQFGMNPNRIHWVEGVRNTYLQQEAWLNGRYADYIPFLRLLPKDTRDISWLKGSDLVVNHHRSNLNNFIARCRNISYFYGDYCGTLIRNDSEVLDTLRRIDEDHRMSPRGCTFFFTFSAFNRRRNVPCEGYQDLAWDLYDHIPEWAIDPDKQAHEQLEQYFEGDFIMNSFPYLLLLMQRRFPDRVEGWSCYYKSRNNKGPMQTMRFDVYPERDSRIPDIRQQLLRSPKYSQRYDHEYSRLSLVA